MTLIHVAVIGVICFNIGAIVGAWNHEWFVHDED